MQPIKIDAVEQALDAFLHRVVYLHLETTAGAYTAGGFGAFIRNAKLQLRSARVRGSGPFRLCLDTEIGMVYAEGLTHWEEDTAGRLLLAGHDAQGRLTVSCEVSPEPFGCTAEPAAWEVKTSPVAPTMEPPTAERRVVAVLAHPDDETFGCGGTLARYTQGGVPVALVCGTRGEQGRNMGNPTFATRESLPHIRVEELRRACAALGIDRLHLLGVWDKTTEFSNPEVLAGRIASVLKEEQPSVVITHHPEHGGHPDHCAIGQATIRAICNLPVAERPRVHCLISPRAAEKANIPLQSVDITLVREMKEKAVAAHRSQSEPMRARAEENPEERKRREEFMNRERYMVYEV